MGSMAGYGTVTRGLLAVVLTGLCACKETTAPPPPAPIAMIDPDPVLGVVDLETLRLSHVRARLRQVIHGDSKLQVTSESILWAASDLLVVREAGVLDQKPRPGEKMAEASDRFLAAVWNPDRGCDLDEKRLRFARLENLARYKHPPSHTVWDAQVICCDDGAECPTDDLARCREATKALIVAFAEQVRTAFARLPPLGAAADVTAVDVEESPLRAGFIPTFEEAVAARIPTEPRLRLRRYTWFEAADGFPPGTFRPGEPVLAAALAPARLGDVVGPLPTAWGWSVAVAVARAPLRTGGLDDKEAQQALRRDACAGAMQEERARYRERLLKGARWQWEKAAVRQQFGDEVLARLPGDWRDRQGPL